MATITATKAYQQVANHAEKIKNDEPQRVETCSPGDAWAQGDILLVFLEVLPYGCKVSPKPELQLAPGTTQGSRHCLDSLEGIKVYWIENPTPLDGPVIESEREFTLQHPEHGDVTLPAGIWGVVYQRAYADELRRIRD